MREVEQTAYQDWLAAQGLPAAHISAHLHAARVFRSQGGTSREAMSTFIRSEAANGSEVARVRNLQAAAKYLLAFKESGTAAPLPPAPEPAPPADEPLELDLATPPPLVDAPARAMPIAPAPAAQAKAEPLVISLSDDTTCACSAREPGLAGMKYLKAIVLLPAVYWGLRVWQGKTFALMVDSAILAGACLLLVAVLRVACERCDEPIEVATLTPAEGSSVLKSRLKFGLLAVLFTLFALHEKGTWDENRKWEKLSDADWEAYEREEEARHQEILEMGYSYDDDDGVYYDPNTKEIYWPDDD